MQYVQEIQHKSGGGKQMFSIEVQPVTNKIRFYCKGP